MKFSDVDRRVQTICRIVQLVLNAPARLTGSYAFGLPALDSDIDISVDIMPSPPAIKRAENAAQLLGARIDINTTKGGFEIE